MPADNDSRGPQTKADPQWLASKSSKLEAEYNVVLGLLQGCRYGKHQLAKVVKEIPRDAETIDLFKKFAGTGALPSR